MARMISQKKNTRSSLVLRKRTDAALKASCRDRMTELNWDILLLARRVYAKANPTTSEIVMLKALLRYNKVILGNKGIQIMTALGMIDLRFCWKDWLEEGTLTPSKAQIHPHVSEWSQRLGEQARDRIQRLGFTQEKIAAQITGAYSDNAIRPQALTNYLNGKISILTPTGFQILDALGLESIEILWEDHSLPLQYQALSKNPE